MRAVIQKADNGQFYYTLHGKNGKVLTTSETMKRKGSCVAVCKKYFPAFKITYK